VHLDESESAALVMNDLGRSMAREHCRGFGLCIGSEAGGSSAVLVSGDLGRRSMFRSSKKLHGLRSVKHVSRDGGLGFRSVWRQEGVPG